MYYLIVLEVKILQLISQGKVQAQLCSLCRLYRRINFFILPASRSCLQSLPHGHIILTSASVIVSPLNLTSCLHVIKIHVYSACTAPISTAQSCPILCDPMVCSLQVSSVHRIFQARVLGWVASFFSRGSSRPRDQTGSPALQTDTLPSEPPGKPPIPTIQDNHPISRSLTQSPLQSPFLPRKVTHLVSSIMMQTCLSNLILSYI